MSVSGYVVQGDSTSHGGTVLQGDQNFTIDNVPVARVGDQVWCPRCGRMTTIVSSRKPSVIDGNSKKPYAFDQDTTDCGATLQSRHNGRYGAS